LTEAGRTIAGRYELVSPLGEGGMGVVWRARDTRLGRAVAVKLLAAASLGSDVARKRLVREARAAAALEHDGIIRVYDVGETEDGGAFLVMELVRGRSFRSELLATKPPLSRIVAVTVQAARALHVAHLAGIVHRDIKPDNIMIRDSGIAIVVDFGVAKPISTELAVNAETIAGVTNASLTGSGQLIGTPAYLSPEQARGHEVTAATDQFALAVTAHEAMTGKLPWKGEGVIEIVASILRDEPELLTTLVPGMPQELESVMARALAKKPADRWPDLAAFADALEAAAIDLPEPSDRPSMRTRRASTPAEGRATPAHAAGTPKDMALSGAMARPATRGRRIPIYVALAAAAALGVGWYTMHARDTAMRPVAVAPRGPARVACPQFVVTGVDEPWLGAAAAALACERFSVVHGGMDARIITPAELANAPRELKETVPTVFERADARATAVGAAATGAESWLDGTLDKQAGAYKVLVTLRKPDGAEIAHGEGQGVEIFEAVREAVKPLLGAPDEEESAALRDWLDVGSPAAALALLDMRTAALIEDPISLKEACLQIEGRTDLLPRVRYLARATCSKKLRTGAMTDPPPPIDESTPGALITTILAQGTAGGPAAVRERAGRLERERDKTPSPEGRSRLSAAAAEVYNSIGDERARDASRVAVQATPKAVDWRTSAWHRVAFSSEAHFSIAALMVAWQPWEPISQTLHIPPGQVADPDLRGIYVRRSHLLSQRGFYAYADGSELLVRGRIEEARSIADLTHDELLRADILLAEAKYGLVLTNVPRLLGDLKASDETASLAIRLALDGVQAASIVDRPADFVDAFVTRWVESEPHHIIDGVVPFYALVAVCCQAPRPIGKRCIERIQKLRAESKLPTIFTGSDVLVAGAARYVADDYRGAAKVWRTSLRTPGWLRDPIREPMANAFDRGGEPELATEIDAPTVVLVDLPRTADLAWVREARRAQKRGDNAKARKLAQAVVDKWRFADEDVPAMAEMKALLAKLPK
jgi:Protein kinase domain